MSQEYISVPPEKYPGVRTLDKVTEKVYDRRESLANFLLKYRKYLKRENGTRIGLADLAEEIKTEPLDKLISWSAFERMAKEQGLSAVQIRAKKAVVRKAIEDAIESERALEQIVHEETDVPVSVAEYYRKRVREFGRAKKQLEEFADHEREETAMLDVLTSEAGPPTPETGEAMDDQRKIIMEIAQNRDDFISKHPEAYFIEMGRELRTMKDAFDETGKIVETPYVREKIDHIMEIINAGSPVFIHGELGTGKSELARHLARTRLSAPHLKRWEAGHLRPDKSDSEAIAAWEAERERESETIEIAGHRGLEAESLLAERIVTLRDVPPPGEQAETIEENWQKKKAVIMEQKKAEGKRFSPRELKEYEKTYREAYLQSFRSPVETRRVLGPLFRAMQEGRPLLIDEMNAIPHHALIVMNDYLTRRPGEIVSPPFADVPPFKVLEGFCVLATGNYKPEDGLMYAGRQKLDAAYLSRFGVVQYDYLPGHRELEAENLSEQDQRDWRRQNELLLMIATRLMDKNLSLTLPKSNWSRLEKLAMAARAIQDIFSEVEMGEAWYTERGSKPKEVLKENVLSLRHLLRLMDIWVKEGYRYPFDVYLYRHYVERSKGSRPEEMKYLFQKLQVVGDFFDSSEGWPDSTKEGLGVALAGFNVSKVTKKYDKQPSGKREKFSSRQMIEKLFGPPPERMVFLKDELGMTEKKTSQESDEEKLARARALALLGEISNKAVSMQGEDFGKDFNI